MYDVLYIHVCVCFLDFGPCINLKMCKTKACKIKRYLYIRSYMPIFLIVLFILSLVFLNLEFHLVFNVIDAVYAVIQPAREIAPTKVV